MTQRGLYQIGEAADRVGLSLRTVRYYEELGLVVPSKRSPGGFRLYTDEDIERLALIKEMKPLGLRLEEMRSLLEAHDRLRKSAVGSEEFEKALDRLSMFAESASSRCDNLRDQLEMAQAFADRLHKEIRKNQRLAARRKTNSVGESRGAGLDA